MRRWKVVGSVNGRDNSVRSNKSREESPFRSFHYSLQNKSEHLPGDNQNSFCYDYMQKKKEHFRNLTFDANSQNHIKSILPNKDDMFTNMRNILRDESLQSKVSAKSLSHPSSKEKEQTHNSKDQLQKATSKMHNLKKEQSKLKSSLQAELAGIKNIMYQMQQAFHSFNNRQDKSEETEVVNDPTLLKEILLEAVSIEKYFGEMDRRKMEIMNNLSSN